MISTFIFDIFDKFIYLDIEFIKTVKKDFQTKWKKAKKVRFLKKLKT
jgi:hypothetical protein